MPRNFDNHKCGGWLCKAKATNKGWEHPETGEVFKNAKFSDAEIAKWNSLHGFGPAPVVKKVEVVETAPAVEVAEVEAEPLNDGLVEIEGEVDTPLEEVTDIIRKLRKR